MTYVAQTTCALADWKAARARYHAGIYLTWWEQHEARRELRRQRKIYRDRVLLAYRAYLLPMKIGDVVPNGVADLLAEEWDQIGRAL